MAHPRQPLVDAEFEMAKRAAYEVAKHLERMCIITEEDIRSADIPVEFYTTGGKRRKWVVRIDLDTSNETVLQVGRDQ